jgi:hypothetical protein
VSGKLLLIHGSVTELATGELLGAVERVKELKTLLRESLNITGDGAWHRKVYEALGEQPPPLRKLKGPVPRYQRTEAATDD